MTSTSFDLLGLGVVTVDDLLYVDVYPPAERKVRVNARERQVGGLTGIALVAASRLGARCAYAGVMGQDALSRFVRDQLTIEGVDLARSPTRADERALHATVIVDETNHTRTIFYELGGHAGAATDHPPADFIRASKVLFVDRYGMEGMIRAARIARDAGRPVVADFESGTPGEFDELLHLVDHLIVPLSFASRFTGRDDPEDALRALWRDDLEVAAVTCGTEGVYYLGHEAPREVRHHPAFRVDVVDTTGCGDVFHGAYAAALAQDLPLDHRIHRASAAAALKATRRGGQHGAPRTDELEAFLASQA